MEVIKKNLFSIICGVIALLAVATLFWPLSNLYAGLGKEVDDRIAVSRSLDTLSDATRSMPQLSPDDPNPAPLDVFPNDSVIAAATAATQQVTLEAQNMLDYAKNLNSHLPLVSGELPKPVDAVRYAFVSKYASDISNYSQWQKILDSTTPPTPAEVQAEKDKLKEEIDKQRLSYGTDGTPDPQSVADAQQQYDIESASVQPGMELQRAQQHRIYLLLPPTSNPLPIDPNIKISSFPSAEQICDAQIVIWMLDDITKGIAFANDNYSDPATPGGPPQHDILHSAVKAIEGIDPPSPMLPSTGGVDATAGVSTPVPKVTTASPTGRVCNGLYDVLRFKVRLVVDAAKLAQIVKAVEVGQFITVLNVQITEVVDPAVAASNPLGGYRYGNKPVLRVELDCEELLMRKWTDDILPDDRKNGLGKAALGSPTDNGGGQQYDPNNPSMPPGPGIPGGYGGPPNPYAPR